MKFEEIQESIINCDRCSLCKSRIKPVVGGGNMRSITNILKCRPPQNRDPKPDEQEACIKYLREQYKIMNPRIVVCLGRIAAQRIIDKNFSITRQHGTWTVKKGVFFTATFHPSALLRNPNNMQYAEDDFREIRNKIDEIWRIFM